MYGKTVIDEFFVHTITVWGLVSPIVGVGKGFTKRLKVNYFIVAHIPYGSHLWLPVG
jgi:hypothetical protein